MEKLYFDTLTFAQGSMYIVASNNGLAYIGTPNASFDEVKEWAKKPFKGYSFEENQEQLQPYTEQ